ncbi:hypothetical protein [Haloplanus litoreus]|uniref:hypothetical protein n=1 Tax=Haloplanus litoreus TaxID=767515 RepID=UPI0036D370AA
MEIRDSDDDIRKRGQRSPTMYVIVRLSPYPNAAWSSLNPSMMPCVLTAAAPSNPIATRKARIWDIVETVGDGLLAAIVFTIVWITMGWQR